MNINKKALAVALGLGISGAVSADIVHLDDVIVDGSLCVGMDCVNGESFGFDTLRLKENNLRIHFQDTSASASFPSNDWRIVINDSSNGGANYFGVEDSTAGRRPFTIEAGAQANTLYVEADGDVGIKQSNPVVDVHITEGNTPTVRLEQDGSDGFTAQSWDMAGNETNFFVRDVTNGSKLPFRIKPNAPTDSIYVDTDGVGFGINNAADNLHIRAANDPGIFFDENNDTTNSWTVGVFDSFNNGFGMTNKLLPTLGFVIQPDKDILMHTGGPTFTGGTTSFAFQIDPSGNIFMGGNLTVDGSVTVDGTLAHSSSRSVKDNINLVDNDSILAKVEQLDIASWSYKKEKGITHIGPIAEDFYEIFETGADAKHISTVDTSGVSLAAIKALSAKVKAQDKEIEELKLLVKQLVK